MGFNWEGGGIAALAEWMGESSPTTPQPSKQLVECLPERKRVPFQAPCLCHRKKKHTRTHMGLALQLQKKPNQARENHAHTQILFFQYQQLRSRCFAGGKHRAINTACGKPLPSVQGSMKSLAASLLQAKLKTAVINLHKIAFWLLLRIQYCIKEVTSRGWLHMRGFHKAAYCRPCGKLGQKGLHPQHP